MLKVADIADHPLPLPLQVLQVAPPLCPAGDAVGDEALDVGGRTGRAALRQAVAFDLAGLFCKTALAFSRLAMRGAGKELKVATGKGLVGRYLASVARLACPCISPPSLSLPLHPLLPLLDPLPRRIRNPNPVRALLPVRLQ